MNIFYFSYKEDQQTCQCKSSAGESIFYRNMGMIPDWDKSKNLGLFIHSSIQSA